MLAWPAERIVETEGRTLIVASGVEPFPPGVDGGGTAVDVETGGRIGETNDEMFVATGGVEPFPPRVDVGVLLGGAPDIIVSLGISVFPSPDVPLGGLIGAVAGV